MAFKEHSQGQIIHIELSTEHGSTSQLNKGEMLTRAFVRGQIGQLEVNADNTVAVQIGLALLI